MKVTITVEDPAPGITLLIRVGEGEEKLVGAPAAPPRTPSTAIVEGAWTADPVQVQAYYPSGVDEGQHDHWKREILVAAYQMFSEDLAPNRGWFDLGPDRREPVMSSAPLGIDLCQTCSRLGLRRLVVSALGWSAPVPGDIPLNTSPVPVFALEHSSVHTLDELLGLLVSRHLMAVNNLVAGVADEGQRSNLLASYELTPGDNYIRLDLDLCPPLSPLILSDEAIRRQRQSLSLEPK